MPRTKEVGRGGGGEERGRQWAVAEATSANAQCNYRAHQGAL
eukprot:COSAG06_NODE_73664_length_154_cov_16.436364_1_plen_41_part_01